jgi:uncharacterized membrane protein
MRSTSDRVRQAISFELIGLALVTPLGAWGFDLPMADISAIGVGGVVIATIWNYLYNVGFDAALHHVRGGTHKSMPVRILHAVLFDVGLLAMLMPLIAWYLGISLLHALAMDVAFALFYMVYTFVFNWAYDLAFPLPVWQEPARTSHVVP